MPRMLDAVCHECDYKISDLFCPINPERILHGTEDGELHEMEYLFLPRRRERTQWEDRDAVVVFRKPDGSYSYPAINTKQTPPGCERVVMRSLREVERFEKKANVRSEVAWFDRGSGRGHDD